MTLLMGGVVMMGVTTFTGCKKDEPTPEIVENPLDKEVYYITGRVVEGTKNLEGVKVSSSGTDVTTLADGSFQLPVTKKGVQAVTFSKSGYVTVLAEAAISSDMKKHSSVSLVQHLTALATSVKVKPDADTMLYDVRKKIAILSFPAGVVDEETDMTVTEYIGGTKVSGGHAALSTINCLPDGKNFGKSVEVAITNATSPAIFFSDVRHYVETNGTWQQQSVLTYDKSRNVYIASLNGFSNHSFGVTYTVKNGGTSIEDAGSVVIDNMGNMQSKESGVSAKHKVGYTIEGDLKQLISARFSGLSSADVEALAGQLENVITSTQGMAAGVSEVPFSLGTAKLSGDMKMTVDMKIQKVTSTLSFNLNYQGAVQVFKGPVASSAPIAFDIPISIYSGIKTTITTQYGTSHGDHSGGSIN